MSDRAPITADLIMSTRPCERWPRAKIERVLAHLDCASWTALAESARAAKWRLVSLTDLRLTAARYAAQHHRPLLVAWVQHVTRQRVAAYRRRWPRASAEVVALWDRLDAWDGTAEQARVIRSNAWRVYDATAADYAAYVATATAADAAYAADADADAAAAYASDAADAAAAYDAAAASDDAAYDAYAAAASDVATAAYAAAAAADASSWDGLRHLCGLLDGTVQP